MKALLISVFAILLFGGIANAQSVQHNLTWTDTNSGQTQEEGIKVEQKIDTGAYVQVGQVLADITAFSLTFPNPFPGQHDVCYRVRAFNSAGDGPYSTETCIQTPIVTVIKPVPPGQPIIQQIILP